MADLKQFSKNFRKDLGDVEPQPQQPGMFDSLIAMLPSSQPDAAPVAQAPAPVPQPSPTLDQSAADFFTRMKKR